MLLLITIQNLVLGLHLLAVTLWMAGHILLLAHYIPKALKKGDRDVLKVAYDTYKGWVITLLIVLTVTGMILIACSDVAVEDWMRFDTAGQRKVSIKLVLLGLTVIFAWSTRYSIMPKLESGEDMLPLIYHIACIVAFSASLVLFQYVH